MDIAKAAHKYIRYFFFSFDASAIKIGTAKTVNLGDATAVLFEIPSKMTRIEGTDIAKIIGSNFEDITYQIRTPMPKIPRNA